VGLGLDSLDLEAVAALLALLEELGAVLTTLRIGIVLALLHVGELLVGIIGLAVPSLIAVVLLAEVTELDTSEVGDALGIEVPGPVGLGLDSADLEGEALLGGLLEELHASLTTLRIDIILALLHVSNLLLGIRGLAVPSLVAAVNLPEICHCC